MFFARAIGPSSMHGSKIAMMSPRSIMLDCQEMGLTVSETVTADAPVYRRS